MLESKDEPRRPRARRQAALNISKLIGDLLKQKAPDDPRGRTNAQVLAQAIIDKAMEGNPTLIREILNRIDGPPAKANAETDTRSDSETDRFFDRLSDAQLASLQALLESWASKDSPAQPS